MKTWIVMNDLQIGFHDGPVVDLVLKFVDAVKPHGVVLNGDIVDCYEISDFRKNPRHRNKGLDQEVKAAGQVMNRLAKSTKERVWLGGNHEDRWRKLIWDDAPQMSLVHGAEFPAVFKLADYGFQWKEWGGSVTLGRLMVTHGFLVAQHSAVSGKRHFERLGTSVLIGHTHRLGIYFRSNARGIHAAFENGCLCRLNPEYVQYPDWQQGFSVVHVADGGWFNVQQIPIINRKGFFYGKDWFGRIGDKP